MVTLEPVETPHIGATVWLRAGTTDRQVWADTFTGLYHVPPRWMPEPATVLDLGANVGLTAAHYRSMWPDARIVAVELDKGNAEVAQRNFDGPVIVAAVAGVAGEATYEPAGREDGYHVGDGSRRVPALRLETLVARYLARRCDFAKLDVEGAEWEVFADGEWRDLVAAVLVELHGDGSDEALVERAAAELHRIGYPNVVRHWQHPRSVFAW